MNKPRLIDANELKRQYTNAFVSAFGTEVAEMFVGVIDQIPTACDIDKVVEQLEGLETYKQTVTMEKHPFCASEIETVSKKKAIKIVKGNYSEKPNSLEGGAE